MNISISTLRSALKYNSDFEKQQQIFLESIEKQLNLPLKTTVLDDYDCDLKLIFVQTGGVEGLFLKNFDKLQPPYYILTNGSNNSLAASMEILTYLKNKDLDGEIIHGNIEHISRRIMQLCNISSARKKLASMRLGIIGKPSDWLISSVPDYGNVSKLFGTEITDIALSELEESAKTHHSTDKQLTSDAFDAETLQNPLDVYESIKQIVKKYRLDGFTLRCFDLLGSIKMTGCMALAFFNSEKVVAACEGDLMALLSMSVMHCLTGQSSFQANPSKIDTAANDIVLAHCTLPLDMTESYRLDTHFESGIGVAVKGELRKQEVTVLRLSSDLKHYFLSKGTITENLHDCNLCRTQIKVHLDSDVKLLLNRPCGNHHIVCYGDHCDETENFLNSYGLVRIG